MNYLNNKGVIFPLISKNFNGTQSNETNEKFKELKDVLLDIKVIGANKGCYYKLNWLGNGFSSGGYARYDILVEEYIKDNFATNPTVGKKVISNLSSNNFKGFTPSKGVETLTFKSIDQTITFVVTIDYTAFTSQYIDIAGESFIIDESCYIYDNSSFVEIDFSNASSPKLNVYSNKYKFEFKKHYSNQIFGWWKTYKKNTSFTTPSINLGEDITDFGIETDLIGPIVTKAVNNGSQHDRVFCGGQHGADNSTSGAPTAETRIIEIWIDGTNIISSGTYACKEIDVYVSNYIMSYNTIPTKRYTINEMVHYKIRNGKIEVEVTLRPLEHIKVETYYGMQMVITDYSHIQFNVGWKSDRRQPIANTEGALKKNYFYNSVILNNNNHNDVLEMKIYNEGLGNREFVDDEQSLIFTTNGKVYHRLCGFFGNTKSFDMFPNKLYYWKGYYHFKSRI